MAFNFEDFRRVLLSKSDARAEEKIEVNQRHLIDKILARYSAEHTIYREVLQNANDANARNIEIIFEKSQAQQRQSSELISSIVLRNNGRPFDVNDWDRLKKIAEGNPDEQKIGFFGVGFYSLFSICDEPFVVSGKSCLAFYWNGDQLYARAGQNPTTEDSSWTTIFLKLREPIERPNLDEFAHFLTKALLFTTSLESITVLNRAPNEAILFRVSKKRSSPLQLPINAKNLLSSCSSTPLGLFTIKSCDMQAIKLDLDKRYLSEPSKSEKSLLSSIWSIAKSIAKDKQTREAEEMARNPGIFSLFLHIINCDVKIHVNSSFSSSLERITKKRPASVTRLSLLYSTFSELSASSATVRNAKHPVLDKVIPTAEDGKIFIGFETHQTTGCAVHITGPFIPTVERESLDFVEKTLCQWNEELLRIGGKMIRLLYQIEMDSLAKLYPERTLDQPEDYWLRCSHILKSFGVGPSSPSTSPSYILIRELFAPTRLPMLVPSTIGIVPINEIRRVPKEAADFVNDIPELTSSHLVGCEKMIMIISKLTEIPDASVTEIMHSLKGRQLSDQQLASCLEWIILMQKRGTLGSRHFYSIVSNLMVPVGQSTSTQYVKFSNVTHFPSGAISYESDMPLPLYCLSPRITERIPGYELSGTFNLMELSISDWAKDVCVLDYVNGTPEKAEKFLMFLSRHFSSLSDHEKAMIASNLSTLSIIPTKHGLLRPCDSYLEEVKSFGDVAIIDLKQRWAVSDLFLISIGVQSHIDVALIFSKLSSLDWDHRQLIKYLVKVENQLTEDEIQTLRIAQVFPAIGHEQGKRYSIGELFIDHPVIRFLGLPLLDWKDGSAPSPHSETTRFMIRLGLKVVAPWEDLLRAISKCSKDQRLLIFRYFFEHYDSDYRSVYNPAKLDFGFLPQKDSDELAQPSEIFADEGLSNLGFKVLSPELKPYASLFGIKNRPSSDIIVTKISSHLFDLNNASILFAYLSTILGDFNGRQLQHLSQVAFIPVKEQWWRPIDVYFSRGKYDFGEAFKVVEFGTHAQPFLTACGVRNEPKASNIAIVIGENPQIYLSRLGSETFLDVLRWIALEYEHLSKDAVKCLKNSKVLLGIDYNTVITDNGPSDDVIESKYVLASSAELYIIDDTISQQIFQCLAVPSDPTLEQFYTKLGSTKLSSCVKMSWQFRGVPTETNEADSLQKLIQIRAPLLVAEQPSSASKHHHHALDRLIKVRVFSVDSIIITRKFKDRTHNQQTTAFLKDEKLILITDGYDFFDVANVLARLIYVDSSRLPDSLLISTLLSSSLSSLRSKGFPVDRILLSRKEVVINPEPTVGLPPEPPPIKTVSEKGLIPSPPLPTTTTTTRQDATDSTEPSSHQHQEKSRSRHSSGVGKRMSGLLGAIKDAFGDRAGRLPSGSGIPAPIDKDGTRSSLSKSISTLRKHDRSSIDDDPRSIEPVPVPPSSSNEADSYCEIIPGHSLQYIGLINQIPIYVRSEISQEEAMRFVSDHSEMINGFASVLLCLGDIFKANPGALHIFYDPKSLAIAFNRNQTLFFNYAHYYRQQEAKVTRDQLMASWYMTICHELAHNFIM